jgi:hypothetical protein
MFFCVSSYSAHQTMMVRFAGLMTRALFEGWGLGVPGGRIQVNPQPKDRQKLHSRKDQANVSFSLTARDET